MWTEEETTTNRHRGSRAPSLIAPSTAAVVERHLSGKMLRHLLLFVTNQLQIFAQQEWMETHAIIINNSGINKIP